MKRLLYGIVALILAMGLIPLAIGPVMGDTLPSVSTDKEDYSPGETVIICGSGFDACVELVVRVTRPGGSVITGDGSGTSGCDAVTTDSDGSFIYFYKLDGIFGLYTVDVLDGETVLATTTFTDATKLGAVTVGAQSPDPVTAGNSATYTITVSRGDGSGAFSATLSVTTALPAGASASFSPNSVSFAPGDTSKTSTLTITTASTTPAGNTTFTVRAYNAPSEYAYASGTLAVIVPNPVPTISSISPASKTYGDDGFTMTVHGTGFVSSSVVRFDGSDRVTTYVSATELQATILASDLMAAGAYSITVFNPAPGGGTSNAATFTVNKADATINVTGWTGTYDGDPHGASGTATGVKGEDLSSSLNLGATFTDVPGGTAHWTFTGGTNYNDASGDVDIVINKADAIIVITPYHVTYDGNPHTATGTATGVKGEDLSSLLDLTGTTHTDAGDYPSDPWTFAGNINYNSTSGTVHDQIDKATPTISITGGPFAYDGNQHAADVSVKGVLNETVPGTLVVTYTGTGGTSYGPTQTPPTDAGSYSVDVTFTSSDPNYIDASGAGSITINQAMTTTTAKVSAPNVRYMDLITLSAIVVPSNDGSPLAGFVHFRIGTEDYGTAPLVLFPDDSYGAGAGQAVVIAQVKNLPDDYTVTAEFTSTNPNYADSSGTTSLHVDPREADPYNGRAFYTGDLFAWTTGQSSSTATVTLSAMIKDKRIPIGDVRAARVTFYLVNGSTLTPISGAKNLPVGLIDVTDGTCGVASAVVQLNIGSSDVQSFRIAVGISGGYTNNPWCALSSAIVTVAKPIPGGQIVGGGTLLNTNSAGLIKGANGENTDFSFNVKYNKKQTNPQGKVEITIRSYYDKNGILTDTLHTYIVTSNAISLLAVTPPVASFSSKANVVEQLSDGTIVNVGGGAILQLSMNGATKTLAITVQGSKNTGGMWFSSNWGMKGKTIEQLISGGDLSMS